MAELAPSKPPETPPARACQTMRGPQWLHEMCGRPAIGYVISPQGRQHHVCAECVREYEQHNDAVDDLSPNRLGLNAYPPKYQVVRW